jgi:N-acylneuraminate cytidylyltransferase
MNMKKKCLIIIPARAGSKSIKNKNIKKFCGKPLIYWAIKVAKASKLGKIVVSTDSHKIQKYARLQGVDAPFIRPKKYSYDKSPSEGVARHAINFFKKKNIIFDFFILLQPTSPFRIKADLIKAKNIYQKNKSCTAVFSVSPVQANNNPHWMIGVKNNNKAVKYIGNKSMKSIISRRQLLPKVYYRNDFVYLSSTKNILSKKPNFYGSFPMALISDEKRVNIDINTVKEWTVAENLYKKYLKKDK